MTSFDFRSKLFVQSQLTTCWLKAVWFRIDDSGVATSFHIVTESAIYKQNVKT